MSDPTEASLQALIGSEESMTLEFKRGNLLDKDRNQIIEDLSRAVSGLANAVGGRIIIGMDEQKMGKRGVAHDLTGVTNPVWTAHQLQQLIESNIEPPLRPRFFRVSLHSIAPDAKAFVIDVPQGVTAHQHGTGATTFARSSSLK
jgi:predicted HTH transcriptional regulator